MIVARGVYDDPVLPQRPDDEAEIPLRYYVHLVNRRKWSIVIATFVVAALSFIGAIREPNVYEGEAKLVLQREQAETVFNAQTGQANDPARALSTEIEIIKSRPVQSAVQRQLGGSPTVSASAVGETDVISVRARDRDPERAAKIANAYANEYVGFKQKKAVDSLLAAVKEVQTQISAIQAQADALDEQIASGPGSVNTSELRSQRDSLIQQVGAFRQQLDQLQVQARLRSGGAQLVTPAEASSTPVSPRPKRAALVGLILGLVLGLGVALLREQLDESIRTKDDVETVSAPLPVIGIIPEVGDWKDREQPVITSLTDPSSQSAEAYRSLRTSIQFVGLERATGIVQLTSPSASEGKTTTVTNLAVTLAGAGLRVVLVCCDLRRPRLHEFFGRSNAVGFTSVLLGDVPLSSAVQPIHGVPRLHLLASGPPPPNPSELLSLSRTKELFQALKADNDIVLIDSPPALPVTDAAVLSRWVDATVVVVSSDQTTRKALRRALELLNQVGAPLVGIVLNGVSHRGGAYGYGYGYGYEGYQAHAPEGGRHRRSRKATAQRALGSSNGGGSRGPVGIKHRVRGRRGSKE